MELLHGNERFKECAHSAKKIRRTGRIPGVLYGPNFSNLLFEIGEMDLSREIDKGGEHGILNIDINGNSHKTLIKEIQREPVNHKIIHIDLEEIDSNKLIQSEVPILFSGEENVVRNGGILQKEKNSLKVQCKVDNLPKYININITNPQVGVVYRIGDIELAKEITFIDDINSIIATITGTNTNMLSSEDDAEEKPVVIANKSE